MTWPWTWAKIVVFQPRDGEIEIVLGDDVAFAKSDLLANEGLLRAHEAGDADLVHAGRE